MINICVQNIQNIKPVLVYLNLSCLTMMIHCFRFIVIFHHRQQSDLKEWNELAEDEPDVDHPHIRSWREFFHHTEERVNRITDIFSYLMKSVVMTSITVRFTVKAASKKKDLKKVVEYVMPSNKKVGK